MKCRSSWVVVACVLSVTGVASAEDFTEFDRASQQRCRENTMSIVENERREEREVPESEVQAMLSACDRRKESLTEKMQRLYGTRQQKYFGETTWHPPGTKPGACSVEGQSGC